MASSTLSLIYSNRPQRLTQVVATLIVALGPLATGLGKGYSSPALASMQLPAPTNSTQSYYFTITPEQGSWIASLSLLGAFFGGIPSGLAMRLGRKSVLAMVALPFALSWLLTVFASSVYMVYASSFMCGICSAIVSLVTPVYISEIAHPEIRGCLCSVAKLTTNVGMLMSFLLGVYLDWRQLAMVASIAPALLFLALMLIPETPSYLLYRGREDDAATSLTWLRGGLDVTQELDTMKANIEVMRKDSEVTCYREWRRDLVKPVLITCGLMVFQKFSGANAFNFYAVPILSEAFVGINPYSAAVVVGLLQILAGMVSSVLIDTVGRLPLLIVSNLLMSTALAGFGTFLYVTGSDNGVDAGARMDWIPLTCALIFQVAFALGISPISWIYIGELFPLKHRGLGAIANSVSYACSFASVKTFVDFQLLLGLYGAFWLYAGISIIGLVFTVSLVPETKGRGLQEMETNYQTQEKYSPMYSEQERENKLIP
ncbi:facilitated trehalose transporter Tret1-like [Portunus trituberculatus]|uniref:Facilitated trehalose transporter Tret1-2 n=1 Tax=Portunus trituberculatus TaxID=210409 RepID=A0A5B7EVC8_PORTR|nr:facilitated trehalose transporter Tret1-like [Portunus trituberculatus]XP_045130978.1 facilitated trehalose transporter Tret1-like [Portunus trituberculatus]MPC36843.1 Facilitated trehalose transporter Tret1-2 [Portunus trituberculatus]